MGEGRRRGVTGRSFVLGIVVTAVVCTIGGRCSAPAPARLPAKVQSIVTRHTLTSVVDTAAVNRLEREKDEAYRRERVAARARQVAEDSARARGVRADSLEVIARTALTATDSAAAWETAYHVRTGEVADLQLALTESKAETQATLQRLGSAEGQVAIWKTGKLRGDSVIAQLLPLAETAGDRCRILWVVGCPSRKASAIAGFLAGAGAVYVGRKVAKGEIKIRLPSLRSAISRNGSPRQSPLQH